MMLYVHGIRALQFLGTEPGGTILHNMELIACNCRASSPDGFKSEVIFNEISNALKVLH